tara:strand:- start:153 stop:320 length:168 start_codon:yes stop_codon:yes gene_type:complete
MNKKIKDSYSYVYDSNHSKDFSAHHKLYILFLPVIDEQVLIVRLIPCIKKDPKVI